jgi:hypothetical protein
MTEIAPPSIRGILVGLVGASLLFGYASSIWVGYGFYFFKSSNAWRIPFGRYYENSHSLYWEVT